MKILDAANNEFSEQRLEKIERFNRILFPNEYKEFIRLSNGGEPESKLLQVQGEEFVVERFLSIIESPNESKYGEYDIAVVLTQLDDRLSDDPDLLGNEIIPIASMFGGDFICLDYRGRKEPSISIWFHEESDIFTPVLKDVSESFSSFIKMLKK